MYVWKERRHLSWKSSWTFILVIPEPNSTMSWSKKRREISFCSGSGLEKSLSIESRKAVLSAFVLGMHEFMFVGVCVFSNQPLFVIRTTSWSNFFWTYAANSLLSKNNYK